MIRCYANSFEPGEKPWSVDQGSQATEEQVDMIVIGNGLWITNENRNAGKDEPSGWIECRGMTKIRFVQTGGQITAYIS